LDFTPPTVRVASTLCLMRMTWFAKSTSDLRSECLADPQPEHSRNRNDCVQRREERGKQTDASLAVSVRGGELLGISTATVKNYVASRKIHSVRVGRKILIPTQVLDQVMEQGIPKRRK